MFDNIIGKQILWLSGERINQSSIIEDVKIVNEIIYFVLDDNSHVSSQLENELYRILNSDTDNNSGDVLSKPIAELYPLEQSLIYSETFTKNSSNNSISQSNISVKPNFDLQNREQTNPIILLLNKNKKQNKTIRLDIQMELPSKEIVKFIKESFDDFKDNFDLFLEDLIKQYNNIIVENLSEQLKKYYDSEPTIKRSKRSR